MIKIPFPLNCVPVSPSMSVHLWMLVPACRSLSPCLSLVERRNQGCSEAPGTKTLVHGHAREVRGREKASSSSNSSGTSSIPLPEVEERAGARKVGNDMESCQWLVSAISEVRGNENPSKQNAIPCLRLLPHLKYVLFINWSHKWNILLLPLFLLMHTHWFQENPLIIPV